MEQEKKLLIEFLTFYLSLWNQEREKTNTEIVNDFFAQRQAKIFLQPDVSINEVIQPENKKGAVAVCGYCDGVGTFILENTKIICNRCKGTGKQTGC